MSLSSESICCILRYANFLTAFFEHPVANIFVQQLKSKDNVNIM